jgi:hypothetical protein
LSGLSGLFRRGGRAVLFLLIAAGIGSAYFLFRGPDGTGPFHADKTGGTAMAGRAGSERLQRPPERPRMDLSEHGGTETAIFAMG